MELRNVPEGIYDEEMGYFIETALKLPYVVESKNYPFIILGETHYASALALALIGKCKSAKAAYKLYEGRFPNKEESHLRMLTALIGCDEILAKSIWYAHVHYMSAAQIAEALYTYTLPTWRPQ